MNYILIAIILFILIILFTYCLSKSKENFSDLFYQLPQCKKYADYYKSCPFYIESTYNLSKNDISQNLNDSLENANYCANVCYADAYKIM